MTTQAVDQIFVTIKHWLVFHSPGAIQPAVSVLLSVLPLLAIFPGLFAVVTVLERKGLGRMQNRLGPNRVGPFGFLQPLADGLKSLTKEDIVPIGADKLLHFLAPLLLVMTAFLEFAVIPIGRNMVVADMDSALVFFFAVSAAMEVSIFMAGWASRNKYSMLGAMRAVAQMISYEAPLILSSIAVVMIAGSLSTTTIVARQTGYWGVWPYHWYVFTPWGMAGFILFMIAATAESNRSPFDLPEAESEIIAGYFTEYSGFKFALFFLGEYLGMFAISGLAITLFLGGWAAPLSFLTFIPSWIWFFAKLMALISVFIWVRGTLPRLRMDQLMNFAWKFMLPMTLVVIFSAGIWRFMPSGVVRWVVCAIPIVLLYVLLGRALMGGRKLEKRTYRFAE